MTTAQTEHTWEDIDANPEIAKSKTSMKLLTGTRDTPSGKGCLFVELRMLPSPFCVNSHPQRYRDKKSSLPLRCIQGKEWGPLSLYW